MNDYILYTDSACDLPEALLARLGVRYRPLTFAFEGEDEHADHDVPVKDFYAKMRAALPKRPPSTPRAFVKRLRRKLPPGMTSSTSRFPPGSAQPTIPGALRLQI